MGLRRRGRPESLPRSTGLPLRGGEDRVVGESREMTREAGFEQRAAGVASADGDARDQSAIAVHVSPLDSHALLVEQSTCVRRRFSAEGFVQFGRVDAFESDANGLRFS